MLALFLVSCSQSSGEAYTDGVYEFPEEPTKASIEQQIEEGNYKDAEDLVNQVFPLVDTVEGENNEASVIYATKRFTIDEVSALITNMFPPEHESDSVDGKKAIIYPSYFITFQQSEQDSDTVFIEVASDRFVRDNYSPNYFNGLFALWLLDDVLDVDDWHKKRSKSCVSGDCYGGYSSGKYLSPSKSGGIRGGSSTVRGGGPSSGK